MYLLYRRRFAVVVVVVLGGTEFDRGFTSATGQQRLSEIKARARAEGLAPAAGTYTGGLQEIRGPQRDETTHVSCCFRERCGLGVCRRPFLSVLLVCWLVVLCCVGGLLWPQRAFCVQGFTVLCCVHMFCCVLRLL